ncbi:MAG TPA: helix-turn-helix domain-containing protein [Candidatus Eisenbergiella merdavium]|uniref:Helix-turn-helix domain-containing protein n=1 Tax=Candidatus Eisenbergiella merdavium TaxID=2838551 RepID=A0A9D2SQQ9_9FIRM|nr:helix-turn-helix domain-containing protein [Candidatus Eisenbergiella merdavium]
MTVGEKIKTFRTIRGISQNVLGELASIDGTTIRKYELGSRKPKSDQLLKIANALGVSINVFTDFDIETASDVLTLLFKMDEQIDMEIDGEKDSEGNLIPDTIYIRFKHPEINSRLAKFAKAKKLQENLIASKDAFPSEEAFNKELGQMNETCEQIKQHLVDTNRIVKKGASGISVKLYPEN